MFYNEKNDEIIVHTDDNMIKTIHFIYGIWDDAKLNVKKKYIFFNILVYTV